MTTASKARTRTSRAGGGASARETAKRGSFGSASSHSSAHGGSMASMSRTTVVVTSVRMSGSKPPANMDGILATGTRRRTSTRASAEDDDASFIARRYVFSNSAPFRGGARGLLVAIFVAALTRSVLTTSMDAAGDCSAAEAASAVERERRIVTSSSLSLSMSSSARTHSIATVSLRVAQPLSSSSSSMRTLYRVCVGRVFASSSNAR
mmetsp:Transcript_144/g.544  ORF Transcript_144/g.544 Transcript_144/m.544 type:complete len:208 (-) Transcript_144:167-790(-)